MTVDLRTALQDLVAEDPGSPPAPADLWRAGARRRSRTVLLTATMALSVLAVLVVLGIALVRGTPAQLLPAEPPGPATGYPAAVAMPIVVTPYAAEPGPRVATITSRDGAIWLVDATGGVTLLLDESDPGAGIGAPALSPDGRWLSRDTQLVDLVAGRSLPWPLASAEPIASLRSAGFWNPTSTRVILQGGWGGPTFGWVRATDGTVQAVPEPEHPGTFHVAGWLDERTVLGYDNRSTADPMRLLPFTWTLGSQRWEPAGSVLTWAPSPGVIAELSLSPNGDQVVIRSREVTSDSPVSQLKTRALTLDRRTGRPGRFPGQQIALDPSAWAEGSFVGWSGWGCRPAWAGQGVWVTDSVNAVLGSDDVPHLVGEPPVLIEISPRFNPACLGFAGDRLEGTRHSSWSDRLGERLWFTALPWSSLLGALLAGGWLLRRERRSHGR